MGKTIRITLSTEQRRRLRRRRRTAKDRALRRRIGGVLLSAEGLAPTEVARRLGISRHSVQRWRRRWNALGARGLASRKPPGRTPKTTPDYRKILFATATASRSGSGDGRARWTLSRLSAHLERLTGIQLGARRIGQMLRERLAAARRKAPSGRRGRRRVEQD